MAPPNFDGSDSDGFIRAIQKEAFDKGKSRDDAWMADLAGTCFAGDAMIWYLGLDPETQGSWRTLRAAIALKFPDSRYTNPIKPQQPSQVITRRGKLRVACADARFRGYLADTCKIVNNATAWTVEWSSAEPHCLKFAGGGQFPYLALCRGKGPGFGTYSLLDSSIILHASGTDPNTLRLSAGNNPPGTETKSAIWQLSSKDNSVSVIWDASESTLPEPRARSYESGPSVMWWLPRDSTATVHADEVRVSVFFEDV